MGKVVNLFGIFPGGPCLEYLVNTCQLAVVDSDEVSSLSPWELIRVWGSVTLRSLRFGLLVGILHQSFGDYSRYLSDEKQLSRGNISLIANMLLFTFLPLRRTLGLYPFFSDLYAK